MTPGAGEAPSTRVPVEGETWEYTAATVGVAAPAVVPAETPPVTMDTGDDEPWSVREVLARLADAADHLLGDHSCDTHGHEGIRYAVDAARRYLNAPRAPAPAITPVPEGASTARSGIYIASRAKHARRWQTARAGGAPIISSWIDEAGDGDTADLSELWSRIQREVSGAERVVFYVEADDFPFKGALVEIGMAICAGVPVFLVLDPGVVLEERSLRPLGSWAKHPGVRWSSTLADAFAAPTTPPTPSAPPAPTRTPMDWDDAPSAPPRERMGPRWMCPGCAGKAGLRWKRMPAPADGGCEKCTVLTNAALIDEPEAASTPPGPGTPGGRPEGGTR